MFRIQSHDINQPITVWCKICDIVVVVEEEEEAAAAAVGTASV